MTAIDTARLQASWATVARYGDQVPLFFYATLFVTHPDVRDMFPLGMATQRDKLVSALARVVSNVDDLPAIVPLVEQLGRDHRRFAVRAEHFPAVGEALLATLEHFLGDGWNAELAAEWAAAYELVAGTMQMAAEADAHQPPWYDAVVAGVDRRTAGVAVLRVAPALAVPYRAGQSLALETEACPRMWRYYSPATLPDEAGRFELHVRAVGGGAVSTALVHATRPGDALRLGAPVGEGLTLDDACGDLVLIAGGTGLAPLKALVHHVDAAGGRRRVTLFWGGRRRPDLYDLPALDAFCRHDWFDLVLCLSDEVQAEGRIRHGTAVGVALDHGDLAGRDVYVCGSPGMVAGTLAALRAAGVPAARIHHERFGSEEGTRG
jgi:NAD(P)H-flavin reductase